MEDKFSKENNAELTSVIEDSGFLSQFPDHVAWTDPGGAGFIKPNKNGESKSIKRLDLRQMLKLG